MALYCKLVVPRLTDLAMRNKHLAPYRAHALRAADGRVLEIGVGSGIVSVMPRPSGVGIRAD